MGKYKNSTMRLVMPASCCNRAVAESELPMKRQISGVYDHVQIIAVYKDSADALYAVIRAGVVNGNAIAVHQPLV